MYSICAGQRAMEPKTSGGVARMSVFLAKPEAAEAVQARVLARKQLYYRAGT